MGSKKALWEERRWAFKGFLFASTAELYLALLRRIQAKPPDCQGT